MVKKSVRKQRSVERRDFLDNPHNYRGLYALSTDRLLFKYIHVRRKDARMREAIRDILSDRGITITNSRDARRRVKR